MGGGTSIAESLYIYTTLYEQVMISTHAQGFVNKHEATHNYDGTIDLAVRSFCAQIVFTNRDGKQEIPQLDITMGWSTPLLLTQLPAYFVPEVREDALARLAMAGFEISQAGEDSAVILVRWAPPSKIPPAWLTSDGCKHVEVYGQVGVSRNKFEYDKQ